MPDTSAAYRPDIAIDEVKRSGMRSASSRQSQRLDRKLRLLATEWDSTGAEGDALSLWRLPLQYRHRLDDLAAVLARARRDGYAEAQPHPALVVSAANIEWAFANQDRVPNWTTHAADTRGWNAIDERHFGFSALTTRMRERRHPGSAHLAPTAIFPLCAEDIVDILMGFVDYNVTLRVDVLAPAFAERGIDVEFATGRDADQTFLRARRGRDEIVVPAHLREQMLRELTTVDTMVDVADALLTAVSLGAPTRVKRIVVCDERESWPPPPMYLAA